MLFINVLIQLVQTHILQQEKTRHTRNRTSPLWFYLFSKLEHNVQTILFQRTPILRIT